MKKYLCVFLISFFSFLSASEESGIWPLGPIGGEFRIWTNENFVRVHSLQTGAPGETAGLQVNDFIYGAFGQEFDAIGRDFQGVVRQLGAAIERAESSDGVLPLMVIRSGTGIVAVNVNLPTLGELGPLYPMVAGTKYDNTYEYACEQLHLRIMADNDGNVGVPTGFIGLALLGHPNWNSTTGSKPYRLSINKIRDAAIAVVDRVVYSPIERYLLDFDAAKDKPASDNPNFIPENLGFSNWHVGQCVMFLAEYRVKTGDTSVDAKLQKGAELLANRIQYWKQPPVRSTFSPEYDRVRGMTSHGGVEGDYIPSGWLAGINITGVHMFGGLALAKRAGVNMDSRPRDSHLFGYNINAGDPIPDEIKLALPKPMILPRGCEDTRTSTNIDNTTNSPLTTILDPFGYDLSVDQKFWMHWDCLRRSMNAEGAVGYAPRVGGPGDAGGRTPGALFGILTYHGSDTLSAADQAQVNLLKNYIATAHDRHLNAHTYNMGGVVFNALVMPLLDDHQQRFFLENWRFFSIFMRQPDGTVKPFRGRYYGDPYLNATDLTLLYNALPRSIARGGLTNIAGFNQNRVVAQIRKPFAIEWKQLASREMTIKGVGTNQVFEADLIDSSGAKINPAQVNAAWSVTSGPVTNGVFSSPNTLNTTASFPNAGIYTVELQAANTSNSLSTTEKIKVEVIADLGANYDEGKATYRVYEGISGSNVSALTSAPNFPGSPNQVSTVNQLKGTHSGNSYGATLTAVIVPPVTGLYHFYISSDDHSALLFNQNGEDAAGAAVIASVTGWTHAEEWGKYTSQKSVAIQLTAGEKYYLQAQHKENSGGDHVAVGWTTPFNNTITVINEPYIAIPSSVIVTEITSHPSNVNANLGDDVTFSVQVQGEGPVLYQWRHNGKNMGSPNASSTLTINNVGAYAQGVWDCVVTIGNTVLTSNSAALTIASIGEVKTGGLWQEMYTDISGSLVDDLLNHANYPFGVSSSGVINETFNENLGNNYGQRWSGWLVPTETARYRFYSAGDDRVSLYLSSDETESNKTLVHSINTYTSARQWSRNSPSNWIELKAGKRYFVEFFHKESGGGDSAAFIWQKEGDPAPVDGSGSIPSAQLQYRVGGVLPDPRSFAEWRYYHVAPQDLLNANSSGPSGDLDGDKIDNLMEYALALDPNVADAAGAGISYDIETISSESFLCLNVKRNRLATDLIYTVEVCDDLQSWSSTDTVVVENTPTSLRVRDAITFDNAQTRLIRLRVNQR